VVVGNITATESVRLTDKARVVGDLTSPRVVIEAGAAYSGHLEMGNVEGGSGASLQPAARPSPPRLPPHLVPSRVAAAPGAVAARVATASPPRAAPTPRARRPRFLEQKRRSRRRRVGSAPWAKKKLHRRG
jgi:hypothetical protein